MFKKQTVILLMLVTLLGSSVLTLLFTGQLNFAAGESRASTAGLLSELSSGQSGSSKADLSKLETALKLVKQNYYQDVDTTKLVDGAIQGMMNALDDPFSSYMSKETAQEFNSQIQGSFSGIGAEVSLENGKVVVVSPIKGSPAEQAGIRAKDVLLSVNGESLEGLSLNEAVAKIRGPKGSSVEIKVQRSGTSEPMTFTIKRDDIALETVYAKMTDDKIGLIEVTEFSLNTDQRFKDELTKLESQGMKGLVIDVRNNPGGVLSVVENMAGLLVPKGKTIVQVENKAGQREKMLSTGSSTGKAYPVVVLTNKGSASASEILAGALKESAGAKLIGETTYGKGTVQQSYDKEFGDGSLIKITMAKWLTPNGEWIHKKGIKPDIAVDQPAYFSVAPINKDTSLSYDSNSDDVKSAQTMLLGLGYKPGRDDGYFSKETVAAVKQFQVDHKLTESGSIDKQTAEQLEAALVQKIADPVNDAQLNRAYEEIRKEIGTSASK
ncbi:peptidase S41 [Paenibacillus yonginensis]|uniref:Peptidase S41 n=1 Tax=Paenibacillus yonginensis TaxID=1462996 RepID=A0A1B1N3Q7_9BACL|nr:S41 family peptidase [Paenibacillus yonginensis]ANS76063.1 peptidase S41 [Paenibacillus yonginensis]